MVFRPSGKFTGIIVPDDDGCAVRLCKVILGINDFVNATSLGNFGGPFGFGGGAQRAPNTLLTRIRVR